MFIDDKDLLVRGGDGGAGRVSFRRERYLPRGGPDGGDGGRGGSVYALADVRLRTLNHLVGKDLIAADAGGEGGANKRTGRAGRDRVIRVPLGTEVRGDDGGLRGELLEDGARLLLAAGGKGGRGNARFATAVHQAPRYAEKGGAGATARLRLTLKLIADVALVGPPNAGKSSLLAALSTARPKVAAYPFTTLAPQLGIVALTPARAIAVVEVPGLLEGAAEGRGLGHDFLRHVERARTLAVVVDVAAPDAAADAATVLRELARFDAALERRVGLIVANKTDLPHDGALEEKLGRGGVPVVSTSALTGEGLPELKAAWARLVHTDAHSRSE